MKGFGAFYDLYLNGKLTPGAIVTQHPEMKAIWYDEPEHQYGVRRVSIGNCRG